MMKFNRIIIAIKTIIHLFFFLSKEGFELQYDFISIAAFSLCQQTMKLIIERLNRTLVVATYSHRGLSSEDKLRLFSIKKPNTFPVYYCFWKYSLNPLFA